MKMRLAVCTRLLMFSDSWERKLLSSSSDLWLSGTACSKVSRNVMRRILPFEKKMHPLTWSLKKEETEDHFLMSVVDFLILLENNKFSRYFIEKASMYTQMQAGPHPWYSLSIHCDLALWLSLFQRTQICESVAMNLWMASDGSCWQLY